MSKTNEGLVTYYKTKLTLPTIYMLGESGRKLTKSNNEIRKGVFCGKYSNIRYIKPKKEPIQLEIKDVDLVLVSWVGRCTSLGTGGSKANLKNRHMKVIKNHTKTPYSVGCLIILKAVIGETGSRYITAYFKPSSIRKR